VRAFGLSASLKKPLIVRRSDFDFEFPASPAQGHAFANLITELRTAFTALQIKKGDATPYQISVRASLQAVTYFNHTFRQPCRLVRMATHISSCRKWTPR
jgi:hypothetical protein